MSDCKRVYRFGTDAQGTCVTESDKSMNFVLGGKGANLAEMTGLGLPVLAAPGLPGVYAPYTAAELMRETIYTVISEGDE